METRQIVEIKVYQVRLRHMITGSVDIVAASTDFDKLRNWVESCVSDKHKIVKKVDGKSKTFYASYAKGSPLELYEGLNINADNTFDGTGYLYEWIKVDDLISSIPKMPSNGTVWLG